MGKYAGRWDPKFIEQVVPFMSKGYSREALAAEFGTTRMTIYRWCKDYPDFEEAIRAGEDARARTVEGWLLETLRDKTMNVATAIFLSKNYTLLRDRTEITGVDGGPVKIEGFIFQQSKPDETNNQADA